MEVYFGVVDSREKRWFPKVAHAAAREITQLISPVGDQKRLELHAQFDTSEADRAKVVECEEGSIRYTAVVFAASRWQTVQDSIPGATSQLASAVIAVLPEFLRSEVASRFAASGIQGSQVTFKNKTIPTDGLTDFYLFLDSPMELDAFFTLVDRIDAELYKASLGEVSGNAYSVSKLSSCIDLVSADRALAQRSVESLLKQNGIEAYTFSAQQ